MSIASCACLEGESTAVRKLPLAQSTANRLALTMPASENDSSLTVFVAFLRLGVRSFGGPIAHIGYLHEEFVTRRRWLSDEQFAQSLSVCQMLPGPASSQLGFTIGLLRAGWGGALAAFAGFTAPSALLLILLARFAPLLATGVGVPVVHGLKLTAVAVVAHGVLRMARQLTPDVTRLGIAVAAMIALLVAASASLQLVVIAAGALAGLLLCRTPTPASSVFVVPDISFRAAALAAFAFGAGLLTALLWPGGSPSLGGTAAAFYRAGALVFGGGHVVLPLLEQSLVATGWMSADTFLLGYGAAQAIPGPLFSLAGYLGAALNMTAPSLLVAGVAILAVFAPGFLLLVAVLPVWSRVRTLPRAGALLAGLNAAVVGVLAAALYDPVFTSAVFGLPDLLIVAVAFSLLTFTRRSTLWAVACCVAGALLVQAPPAGL